MLVIKFAIRGAKITWLVNDNWIMFISFLLTMVIGIAYRRIKNSNKKIKMPNPKGGTFIDDYIELLYFGLIINCYNKILPFEHFLN
jgi:hypothetical protein